MNKLYDKILRLFGIYGIVHVLAQDTRIKTSQKQKDLIKMYPVQILILLGGAYVVTEQLFLTFLAVSIFYILKYFL